jgi:hypothetical protein
VSTEVGYEARRKHRHDLGHEDHGPVVAAGTTRAIQAILGTWVLLTFAMVIWALAEGGTGSTPPPAAAPAVSAPAR